MSRDAELAAGREWIASQRPTPVEVRCSRCGECKSQADYYKQQLASRAPYCRACRIAALTESRRKERERVRAHRARNRGRLNALKMSLSCVDCGWSPSSERECWRLHFDHVDPATKWRPDYLRGAELSDLKPRRAFRPEWPWERIEAEIALCQPRCNSCHAARTQRQRHGIDPYPLPWSQTRATPPDDWYERGASPSPRTPTPARSAS